MSDYCGLTEQEANEALAEWLAKSTGDYYRAFDTTLTYALGDEDSVSLRGLFTASKDSCDLIEQRLTPEQLTAYENLLSEQVGYSFRALILLDAPTRCRALIAVLNLGKVES